MLTYTQKKYLSILLILTLVLPLVALHVYAATTVSVLDGKIEIKGEFATDRLGRDAGSLSVDGNTATATAVGQTANYTTTVTITNKTNSTADITFTYSFSNCKSKSESSSSGDKNITLAASETYTITFSNNITWTNQTGTLTLSGFTYTEAADESEVEFEYAGGTVTVGGTEITSGDKVNIDSTNGAALVATPNSGYKFLGWVNGNTNILISTDTNYTLKPTTDMTIKAAFASASAKAWFKVGDYMVDDLNVAATLGSVVIPVYDGTLAAGNYTIPAGVTLLIPYNDANTLCTTKPTTAEAYTTPSVYRTLTMANGANLTVNGSLSLSGQMSSKYAYNGMPHGPLSFIKMNSGSTITVESGGALYAWGYITGSGSVEVKSGGTVYECFQIADYRGGDATTQITGKDEEYGVFPFNQYYLQNIEVPMTLYAGAKEFGFTAVTVTLAGVQSSEVPFFGSEAQAPMFIIDSGYVVKDYVEGTGRTDIKIHGNVSASGISISLKVSLIGTVTIDSTKYALPIPHHFTVSVESGTASLGQSIAFLPGSELYIKQGANCTLASGKSIFVYDLDQWVYNSGANGYSGTGNLPYVKTRYVPGGDGTTGRLKDALVQINGNVDASAGAVYVTASGANIYSTGTGVVKVNPTNCTDTIEYQVITNNTDVSSWPEISIQPAILHNENGTYVETSGATAVTTYYHDHYICCDDTTDNPSASKHGNWLVGEHTPSSEVTKEASCAAVGEKTYTCNCNIHSYTEEIPKLPHTEVTDAAVDATCTTPGKTEGSHCSVCGEVIVAQEEVAALGHTEVVDAAVAATCTTPGKTEGKHCSVCNAVIVPQEDIPTQGHSYDSGVITTQPTFDAEGVMTYTCAACGDTKTEPIPKLTVVAKIGNTRYASLTAAYEALLDGDTIVILDASASSEDVTFGKCAMVDASAVPSYEISTADGFEAVSKGTGIWYVRNTGLFDIYASNIKAGDTLDLFFYVNVGDLEGVDKSEFTAEIVRYRKGVADAPKIIPGSEWTYYNRNSLLRICYDDIAAKEMTDKIFITIYKAGEKVSNTRMETIENYALRVLKSLVIDDTDEGRKNAALRTSMVDMLNYGAACQAAFKDYNIENPANANLGAFSAYASSDQTAINNTSGGDGYIKASSVTAETSLVYTLYFDSKAVTTDMAAYVTYVNHSGTTVKLPVITGESFNTTKSGLIGVNVTGLAIADGKQIITCTIKNGTDESAETVTEVKGSVESYIAIDKVYPSNAATTAALQKLMNFIVSAHGYFHFGET